MKKYDESLTKQKAFALTANAATLLRLQRLIFLRIFSHWSQPKVASHTLRAAQPPDFFIYYMSKKIENKQKKHKKRQTKLSILSSFRYSSPANFFAARMVSVISTVSSGIRYSTCATAYVSSSVHGIYQFSS